MNREFRDMPFERRQITSEIVDMRDGPVRLSIADHELIIVDPVRDMGLNWEDWNCEYMIVDPRTFDSGEGRGYKGLWNEEAVVLGRYNHFNRFAFSPAVSREHVEIIRYNDELQITDLDSTNGTYLLTERSSVSATADMQTSATEEVKPRKSDLEMSGKSIASERHSNYNDDSYFIDETSQSAGVFDGLGGVSGSALASQLASEAVKESLIITPNQLPRELGNRAVFEAMWAGHEAILANNQHIMTTGTVARIYDNESGSHYISIGSAGDSRAYVFRDGHLEHMTLDHAYITDKSPRAALELQETLAEATDLSKLNNEELDAFIRRNEVTSVLGHPNYPPTVRIEDFQLIEGDRILLSSDGIHDNLTTSEINEILSRSDSANDAVDNLVVRALQRSRDTSHARAKQDDMTAVVIDYKR